MRLNQRNYQKLVARIVISVIAFVVLAIFVAKGCSRLQEPNGPEVPATTGSASPSLPPSLSPASGAASVAQTTKSLGERKPASFGDSGIFQSVRGSTENRAMAREASSRTGVNAVRARRVVFNSEPLRLSMRGDRLVRFHLFDDTIFSVRFNDSADLKSNRGEMTGVVEGDPDSQVQIWVTKTGISGELSTVGRTFRFVYAGQGQHYIIEVAPR